MEYTSIEHLLSIPADIYFIRYVQKPYYRTKILNLIKDAHDYMIENNRHIPDEERENEKVLIKDIIQCSPRVLMSYNNVGDLTIDTIQEALAINGLSLDMSSSLVASLLESEGHNSRNDVADQPVINITDLFQSKEDGVLCLSLGKDIIPGFECTINIRKL